MRYDYSLLSGRIVEKCGTQGAFSEQMNLSEHSISRKINNKAAWKQTEIERACSVLDIDRELIPQYFFNEKVQFN